MENFIAIVSQNPMKMGSAYFGQAAETKVMGSLGTRIQGLLFCLP